MPTPFSPLCGRSRSWPRTRGWPLGLVAAAVAAVVVVVAGQQPDGPDEQDEEQRRGRARPRRRSAGAGRPPRRRRDRGAPGPLAQRRVALARGVGVRLAARVTLALAQRARPRPPGSRAARPRCRGGRASRAATAPRAGPAPSASGARAWPCPPGRSAGRAGSRRPGRASRVSTRAALRGDRSVSASRASSRTRAVGMPSISGQVLVGLAPLEHELEDRALLGRKLVEGGHEGRRLSSPGDGRAACGLRAHPREPPSPRDAGDDRGARGRDDVGRRPARPPADGHRPRRRLRGDGRGAGLRGHLPGGLSRRQHRRRDVEPDELPAPDFERHDPRRGPPPPQGPHDLALGGRLHGRRRAPLRAHPRDDRGPAAGLIPAAAVRDRQPPVAPERLRRDPDAGRRLAALVLGQVDHAG